MSTSRQIRRGAGKRPDPNLLWRVLRHLERTRNHRALVSLVERWAERGDLPLEALMIQARVLFHLRLLNVALERLRQVSEVEPENIDALVLGAQIFVERDRPQRARAVVDRIRQLDSAHPELQHLDMAVEAAKPGSLPPPEAGLGSQRVAEQIQAAEYLISRGRGEEARDALESLRRIRPDNGRVADLLWALEGDLAGPLSLEELARVHAPPEALGEWDQLEHTESVVYGLMSESDHPTAQIRRTATDGGPGSRDPRFPSLFRRLIEDEQASDDATDGENTRVYEIAESMEETTAAGASTTDHGDTRVMSVIGAWPLGELPTQLYRPPRDATSDIDGMELTDEGIVELVDRPKVEPETTRPNRPRGAIEVVEKYPEPAPLPEPPVEPSEHRDDVDVAHIETTDEVLDTIRPGRRWAIERTFLIGALLGALLVVAGLVHWLQHRSGARVLEEVAAEVIEGDYRGLLEVQAALQPRVDGGDLPPTDRRRIAYAMTELALWWQHTGDPAQRRRGMATLAQVPEQLEERSYAELLALLGAREVRAAQQLASELPGDTPLGAYLKAEAALMAGAPDVATSVLSGTSLAPPMLAAARVRADPAAIEMSDHTSLDPMVVVAMAEAAMLGEVDRDAALALLTDLEAAENTNLSPRQEGRVHAARARIHAFEGRNQQADQFRRRALLVDSWHPDYLAQEAAGALVEQRISDGLADAERCLESAPGARACQELALFALIELDRLEEAASRLDTWDLGRPYHYWVEVFGERDVPRGQVIDDAVWWYAEGWRLLWGGDVEGGLQGFMKAESLASVETPFQEVLVVRSGSLVSTLRGDGVSSQVDPAAALAGAVVAAHRGDQRAAVASLERAVEVGPENGLAQYELGLFHYDPRADLDRARSIWRSYLDLSPSGERASRTRERLARR